MAIILISHDLNVVGGRADEVAVMYAGQIVERGLASQLFTTARMPYTHALLRSSPRLEDPTHTRLSAIPGRPPDLADAPAGCRFHPRCDRTGERCRLDLPPLIPDDDFDHVYRCWYPVGGPTGPEAEGAGAESGVQVSN